MLKRKGIWEKGIRWLELDSQVDKASSNCKFYGALCPVPGEDHYKVAHRDQKGVCMRILLFFLDDKAE